MGLEFVYLLAKVQSVDIHRKSSFRSLDLKLVLFDGICIAINRTQVFYTSLLDLQ